RCGRSVPRQARQQKFCSARCRKLANQRVRKAFLGQDTGGPSNPPKNINGFNLFEPPENGSSIGPNGPRAAVEIEIWGGRSWRQVTSADGVICEVAVLRLRTLQSSQRKQPRC